MKLSHIGEGALPCLPKYKAASAGATQKTLFEPMPNTLEPHGNPAYEGYGFPGTGYGQSRKTAVPLALPKVNGAVRGTRIHTQGTLDPTSDAYSREIFASLAGLGCAHCSAIDRGMVKALNGLGQDISTVQQFANAIVANAIPTSLLVQIHDKIVADEKANIESYNSIQKLKLLDPKSDRLPELERAQQNAWGQTNVAKFYALLLPEMQVRLGFTSGKPHVTPPDYGHIKAGKNPGVFAKVADFLREKTVGDAAQALINQGYMKNSLGGLGVLPVVIGAVAAGLIAAGLYAFIKNQDSLATQANARAAIVASCASGKASQVACEAALQATKSDATDFGTIAKYGAMGLGALVLLQVISSVRAAFPGKTS